VSHLFPVTTVGSWPRPPRVAEAMRAYRHRRIERAERDRVADEAVLRPYFDRLQVTQLVLEYATDRAGTLVAFEGKELGLGVVNPRTEQVETPAQIRSAVEEALGLYPAERVFLNPDCGFGTFSSRPMNTREVASAKVAAMVAAARDLRGRP
jgi:5-methyltetrahydropteroyltriglutamate--homocysteine methyltransferase